MLARKSTFEIGPPLSFDIDLPQTTGLEHLLSAVGADLVNGFQELSKKRRVEVERMEATVEATLHNPLCYLGVVGEEGHTGLSRLDVRAFISSLEDEDLIETIWQDTIERSPILNSLHPRVEIHLSYKVVF